MVDRTLKSNYYYSVPQSALQLMTNIGKGANIDQVYFKRRVKCIVFFFIKLASQAGSGVGAVVESARERTPGVCSRIKG